MWLSSALLIILASLSIHAPSSYYACTAIQASRALCASRGDFIVCCRVRVRLSGCSAASVARNVSCRSHAVPPRRHQHRGLRTSASYDIVTTKHRMTPFSPTTMRWRIQRPEVFGSLFLSRVHISKKKTRHLFRVSVCTAFCLFKSPPLKRWRCPSVCLSVCSSIAWNAAERPTPPRCFLYYEKLPPREIYASGGGLLMAFVN